MKGKFVIPVLASVLILGVLGSAEDAFAPKKLFVGGLSWDAESQSFVLIGEIHHGTAKAAEKSGKFSLAIALTITDPLTENVENEFYDIQIERLNVDINYGELITFELKLPWNRMINNESFEGFVDVAVLAKILHPGGDESGNGWETSTRSDSFGMYVDDFDDAVCGNGVCENGEDFNSCSEDCVPPSEVCDNEIDDDADGDVDCDDSDCLRNPVCIQEQ